MDLHLFRTHGAFCYVPQQVCPAGLNKLFPLENAVCQNRFNPLPGVFELAVEVFPQELSPQFGAIEDETTLEFAGLKNACWDPLGNTPLPKPGLVEAWNPWASREGGA